jgi:phosphoesterase RecJ-like protein
VTERLGALADALPRLGAVRVCIDHHAPRDPLGQLNLVDPQASSTAELVYRLLDALGAELAPAIAVPLYVGVAFDTGWFRYANTTREAHLVAADLCRYGVDTEDLYARLFATHTAARMRLWGGALSGLRVEAAGRLAWMVVDRALLSGTGATREDLEGLAEQGRQVEGVEMSILFREDGLEEVKVSFRSKGAIDVNEFAGRFGGGGHVNASGATLRLPLGEAVARVLAAATALLAGDPAE